MNYQQRVVVDFAEPLEAVLPKISAVLRKHLGEESTDACLPFAILGRSLLCRLGYKAEIIIGYAAWRVSADHWIATHPLLCDRPDQDPSGLFHAWLELTGHVLDFSAFQIGRKLKDAANADQLKVWPPYLFLPWEKLATFRDVCMNPRAGSIFYQKVALLQERFLREALSLDPDEFEIVRRLYDAPSPALINGA
jgi:hypothetical protein